MSLTQPHRILRSLPPPHRTQRLLTTTAALTTPPPPHLRPHLQSFPLSPTPPHRSTHLPIPNRRTYYSPSHPSPPTYTPTERAILTASLPHIPSHGFTPHALRLGALDANYLSISTNLFPSPATALLTYHLTTSRAALSTHPLPYPPRQSEDKSQSSTNAHAIKANLTSLLLKRLSLSRPYVAHLPAALAQLSPPAALHELYLLADEILYLAGDATVTAPGWYLDRVGVGGVYAASELFMMQQQVGEEGWAETEGFVRRRVEEGGRVREVGGGFKRWVGGQVGGVVDGLRVLGWRI